MIELHNFHLYHSKRVRKSTIFFAWQIFGKFKVRLRMIEAYLMKDGCFLRFTKILPPPPPHWEQLWLDYQSTWTKMSPIQTPSPMVIELDILGWGWAWSQLLVTPFLCGLGFVSSTRMWWSKQCHLVYLPLFTFSPNTKYLVFLLKIKTRLFFFCSTLSRLGRN